MSAHVDVAVIGAALNGPVLALALAQAGLRVALIDARAFADRLEPEGDARSYALAAATVRMLEALGLWRALAAQAEAIRAVHTREGGFPFPHARTNFLEGELEGDGLPPGAPMGYVVEAQHIDEALRAAVRERPTMILFDKARAVAEEVTREAARVFLDDGRALTARLLVAADGRESPVARRAGIPRTRWRYGQSAVVCTLAVSRGHNGVAKQIFLPRGPLALLPLKGQRVSLVWTEAEEVAKGLAGLPPSSFVRLLAPHVAEDCGEIAVLGHRNTFPLLFSLAQRWTAPRLALLGDAAHAIHPIAGQGLNIGLKNVAALAEVIVRAARRGEDIGAPNVLARYERWRRPETVAMALAIDAVNRVFSNANPVFGVLRGLGMALVDALAPLRRTMVAQAAGITPPLPQLLAGKPL